MKKNQFLLFIIVIISFFIIYVQSDNSSKLQINYNNDDVLNSFKLLIGRGSYQDSSKALVNPNHSIIKVSNDQKNNNQVSSKRFCLDYKNDFNSVENNVSVVDNDRKSKINSKIPGPIGLPVLGHTLSMMGDLHLQFQKWYKQYGTIFRIRVGCHETVVITGYPTIRKAFIENSEAFANRWTPNSRYLLNKWQEMAFTNGEKHALLNKVVLSEMTTLRLKKMEDHIIQETEKLISLLDVHAENGEPFEINGYLHMFSLNVILRFLFGLDYPYDKVSQTTGIIKSIMDFFLVAGTPIFSDFIPFLKEPSNTTHPFFVFYNKLAEETEVLIKKYQKSKQEETEKGIQNKENETIISGLIREYEKGNITWDNVTHTAIDIVAAGSDTSANTIIFCIVSLINDQLIQSKLQSNISSSISKNENVITYSKYRSSIPYLTMVMKETFRKFPIGLLGIPHVTSEDVIINGYKIAAGTQVFQNIYASHRSEEFFSNPDQFIPERFMEYSNLSYGSQTQILQFGCGVRDCPGKNLAETEIFTLLATLFNRYEFKNPDPSKPLSDIGRFGLTYQPPSTKLIIKKRINN